MKATSHNSHPMTEALVIHSSQQRDSLDPEIGRDLIEKEWTVLDLGSSATLFACHRDFMRFHDLSDDFTGASGVAERAWNALSRTITNYNNPEWRSGLQPSVSELITEEDIVIGGEYLSLRFINQLQEPHDTDERPPLNDVRNLGPNSAGFVGAFSDHVRNNPWFVEESTLVANYRLYIARQSTV